MEKGEHDLSKYILKNKYNLKNDVIEKTNQFYELLNFYKISGDLSKIDEPIIFKHQDIKLENILLVKLPDDKTCLKLIDFGVS